MRGRDRIGVVNRTRGGFPLGVRDGLNCEFVMELFNRGHEKSSSFRLNNCPWIAYLFYAYRLRHQIATNCFPDDPGNRNGFSLEELYEFRLLRQESVMTVGARHFAIVRADACCLNGSGKLLHRGWRK